MIGIAHDSRNNNLFLGGTGDDVLFDKLLFIEMDYKDNV